MTVVADDIVTKRAVHFEWQCNDYEGIEDQAGAPALQAAIGYLATWASSNERYAHCTISVVGRPSDYELVATYRHAADGVITYQIGAIWQADEKRFSFHS